MNEPAISCHNDANLCRRQVAAGSLHQHSRTLNNPNYYARMPGGSLMKDKETTASQGDSASRLVGRRKIIAGAAWTVPVVASAMMAPLAAASTPALACPTIGHSSGLHGAYALSNLGGSGDNYWQAGSSGTFEMTLGNASGGTSSFGVYSSESPSITVHALSYTVTVPYRINWTSTDPTWTVAYVGGSFPSYQYLFTKSANLPTTGTVTSATYPGTSLVPLAAFSGSVVHSSIPVGERVIFPSGQGFQMSASIVRSYTPTFDGNYSNCTSSNGGSGVTRTSNGSVPAFYLETS